ncbi:hypothetical protein HPP92_023177 [Vanilla planifolia]|uniref:RRM domain-containing protein n=1 Tax=Vanilla planifolia TaxID=51239 RepID=A0A835UEC0_VANPL|nr:hypothetical protein HPP92_023177 [Vanilla planifolia]
MEKMDPTDQELQPCTCGYEICVWCWNQIIQTTAMNGSGARCPACRNLYDKEKILRRSVSKERLAELYANKKKKLQKAKQQVWDVGKDLNNVRVIQRNMVYLAGIHINLADEKILRKKEYLGQYGRIVKIVIAQTDGSRLYYSSDTSIVYVTFSKEEEALRCIQVVNGYMLDGRPLRACFGTTRFCLIWLKNQTCSNPNCVFVHNAVPQEDICTRDEVISACTSKLQQYSRHALNNLKHRSGSILPPPLESKNTASQLCPTTCSTENPSYAFGRSYASVAASQNQSKPLSMDTRMIMSSHDLECQNPAYAWANRKISNQICSSTNEIPCSKGNLKTSLHDVHYVGFDHSDLAIMTTEACRPSFADGDYMPSKSSGEFSLYSDGNSANATTFASAVSLDSFSKGEKCYFGTLGSAAFERSSSLEDSVFFSLKNNPSCIETLSVDSLAVQSFPSYEMADLHSDLTTDKLSGGFEDDRLSFQCERELKGFSTPIFPSTCGVIDKPLTYIPTGPVVCTNEQKILCNNSLDYSGLDFEFSQAETTEDWKILLMEIIKSSYCSDGETRHIQKNMSSKLSHVNKPEDRRLKDILDLKLDATDYRREHFVLEQLYSIRGLSSVSKFLLTSASDKSINDISIMDDLCAASSKLSLFSVGKSGMSLDSTRSHNTVNSEACMEDSFSYFSAEASKNSNAVNCVNLLSAIEGAGPPWARAVYHHQTSISTPPGFSPQRNGC